MGSVCVFCASSAHVDRVYFETARRLGALLASNGHTLVYGGGNIGLMGALAAAVHEHGGKVIGVIPASLKDRELAYQQADELVVTADLRERKAVMDTRSDAFIAMPGGYGTLEEVLEVLTLKQLRFHTKPIVFLNTRQYFAPLFGLFDHFHSQRFTATRADELFHVAETPEAAIGYIPKQSLPKAAPAAAVDDRDD